MDSGKHPIPASTFQPEKQVICPKWGFRKREWSIWENYSDCHCGETSSDHKQQNVLGEQVQLRTCGCAPHLLPLIPSKQDPPESLSRGTLESENQNHFSPMHLPLCFLPHHQPFLQGILRSLLEKACCCNNLTVFSSLCKASCQDLDKPHFISFSQQSSDISNMFPPFFRWGQWASEEVTILYKHMPRKHGAGTGLEQPPNS